MANYNWPINPTTINAGPLRYTEDGTPVVVNIDTGTPANSTPLPVRIYDSGGDILAFNNDYGASSGALRTASQIGNDTGEADFGTGATGAQTLRVEANQGAANATPWNIAAASLPLPTGAASEVTLSAINTKTPALVGGAVPVTGPLTDTQLRAVAVPVSGPLTDTQLRATPVPVSGTVAVTGVATEVTLAAMSGKLPATLGQKTMANSMAVVFASDQSTLPVIATTVVNTGSVTNISNLVATAQTFTAPANAIGFKIQAPSTNTENIAFTIGATATISTGILMEPGRSEDFDTGSNISVIATSAAAQRVTVLWKVKP